MKSQPLNPKYTFESFVVAESNKLAYRAALAANGNTPSYNLIFIYGRGGTGKTHLLHAIGNKTLKTSSEVKISHIPCERFEDDLTEAIASNNVSNFWDTYRDSRLLLVDNFQLLPKNEKAQLRLSYTLRSISENNGQIVIFSSHPPEESGLENHLLSSLELGLTVNIRPPDTETKMTILQNKCDSKGVSIPKKVLLFVASQSRYDICQLEGIITKMLFYSSISGIGIDIPFTREVLGLSYKEAKAISLQNIQKIIADYYGLKVEDLKLKGSRLYTIQRQVAMYLCRELTGQSLNGIAHFFGGIHHTTVLSAIKSLEKKRGTDDKIKADIEKLTDLLLESK